ncbi:MAG: hypothetical protein KHY93_15945 [Clostridiales bacterium]|nr:hypothetical protein [Clostridiales bacterium]
MNVLEKIIEEIEEIYIDDVGFGVDCNLQGKSDLACDNCYECMKDVCKNIIRKHMDDATDTNDDWIPVEDGLPEETTGRYYPKMNVATSYGAVTWGFYRVAEKQWYIYSNIHNEFVEARDKEIVAWRPLPEPYKPKKLQTEEKPVQ